MIVALRNFLRHANSEFTWSSGTKVLVAVPWNMRNMAYLRKEERGGGEREERGRREEYRGLYILGSGNAARSTEYAARTAHYTQHTTRSIQHTAHRTQTCSHHSTPVGNLSLLNSSTYARFMVARRLVSFKYSALVTIFVLGALLALVDLRPPPWAPFGGTTMVGMDGLFITRTIHIPGSHSMRLYRWSSVCIDSTGAPWIIVDHRGSSWIIVCGWFVVIAGNGWMLGRREREDRRRMRLKWVVVDGR